MEHTKQKIEFLHTNRHKGIGGSDSAKIMSTNVKDIHDLWLLKTQRKEGDDLSNILPVQIGTLTEDFNLAWFSKQTGKKVEPFPMEYTKQDFRIAHYDGWLPDENALIECKHTNHYNKLIHVRSRYYAQIQHYLMLSGLNVCYLSAIFGNARWEQCAIPSHDDYQSVLHSRQEKFWKMVQDDTEPTEDNTSWRLYE